MVEHACGTERHLRPQSFHQLFEKLFEKFDILSATTSPAWGRSNKHYVCLSVLLGVALDVPGFQTHTSMMKVQYASPWLTEYFLVTERRVGWAAHLWKA